MNLVALLAHEFNPLDSFFFGEVAREWNRVSDHFIQGPVSLKTKCMTIKIAVDSVPESAVASYFVRNGFVPDGRSAQVVVDTVLSQGLLQYGPTVEKHQRQLRAYLFDLIKRKKSIPIIPERERFIGPLWETYEEMRGIEALSLAKRHKKRKHLAKFHNKFK
jgi:hypothetical protein